MRLISFARGNAPSFGIVTDTGVIDAGARLAGKFSSLRAVLAADRLDLLQNMLRLPADCGLDDIRFLPVVADPGTKFLCVGSNYRRHMKEMGREPPSHPVFFIRFADSLVGHGEPLIRPRVSERLDFEGELAVIIGRRARYVTRDRALEYVAGYSCFNDGSVRDYQRHTIQWTAGKNFYRSGAFGPWMLTADEQNDPTHFHLQTRLNGEPMQDAPVSELYFDIPAQIEYCSTWTPLEPGDVLVTGTPGGVGAARTPPVWMKPGDTVEVDIKGVGLLRNSIVDEDDG
jgi:2-keto-4-pentenoate hydratase/2-oxohepta-3-ene-1,7-dioic acid hydratase in catechol pathway